MVIDLPTGVLTKLMFSIPLPPIEVSPNKRSHWAKKYRKSKEYRKYVGYICNGLPPINVKAKITIKFYCGQHKFSNELFYRPRDIDNAIASLKPAIDGIVDAGILKDDSAEYLEYGEVNIYRKKAEHQGRAEVQIIIEPLTN